MSRALAPLIGQGWSFPTRVTSDGTIALIGGDDDIDRSIQLILTTVPGERPMRPEFGCGIYGLIFAPVDASTGGMGAGWGRAAVAGGGPWVGGGVGDGSAEGPLSGPVLIH